MTPQDLTFCAKRIAINKRSIIVAQQDSIAGRFQTPTESSRESSSRKFQIFITLFKAYIGQLKNVFLVFLGGIKTAVIIPKNQEADYKK